MRNSTSNIIAFTVAALILAVEPAFAADGYFLYGYGPRQTALGGAGAADTRDAMGLSVNPGGIVGLERQFQIGMSAIIADRGYVTTGIPSVVAPGDIESGRPLFPVPNGGYVEPIDADAAWGMVSYANGGINTSYSFWNFKPPLGGPLGGGFAGVDLQQTFVSVGYARRFTIGSGSITLGFAPTLAVQMINVQGLKLFAPYSSNMYKLSDMAYDWSYGGGLRAGLEWRLASNLRIGLAVSTPMFMSRFDKYAGLLADAGKFDIPGSMQAGFAWDALRDLTIIADWRHIFYSAVPALGNPTNPVTAHSLGNFDGPGFDWTDTDSAEFGAEWRATDNLTLRGGYHYTTKPLRSRSVVVNIFAPIVNKHHLSGGLNYVLTMSSSLDIAAAYALKNSFTGVEALPQTAALPLGGVNPVATVTPWTRGLEFTIGYNYKWAAAAAH